MLGIPDRIIDRSSPGPEGESIGMTGFGETLPRFENFVELAEK